MSPTEARLAVGLSGGRRLQRRPNDGVTTDPLLATYVEPTPVRALRKRLKGVSRRDVFGMHDDVLAPVYKGHT